MPRTSSRVRDPKGCGITAMERSGQPSALAWARPSVVNAVEQITKAESPSFAASTLSWTLHDVQEPQSPDPVMTASHCSVSSFITASVAAWDALRLRRLMTLATPYLLTSSSERSSTRKLKLGFELSMKPITFPASRSSERREACGAV